MNLPKAPAKSALSQWGLISGGGEGMVDILELCETENRDQYKQPSLNQYKLQIALRLVECSKHEGIQKSNNQKTTYKLQ